jgi:hypothetical protein
MSEEANKKDNLTKFPNAGKANQEAAVGLPSAFDLFSPSVKIIKNNLVAFLILLGVPALFLLVSDGSNIFKSGANSSDLFGNQNGALAMVGLIGGIMTLLFAPGAIVLQLAAVRNQAITWSEAFNKGLQQIWRMLGLIFLTLLILAVSLLLFIVPFFIVLPRVFLASYFLIDQKLGIVESIKASNQAYKEHKGTWGVIGVFVLLSLISIVPILGTIAANILSFLYSPAPALRYEQILHLSEGKAPQAPVAPAAI